MNQYYAAVAHPLSKELAKITYPTKENELERGQLRYYCGWGKCNREWCNCKAFEGNDDLCINCGHPYSEHYGW